MVTWHIGADDVSAEIDVKSRLPNCQFYATGLTQGRNVALFRTLSKAFETAVRVQSKDVVIVTTSIWHSSCLGSPLVVVHCIQRYTMQEETCDRTPPQGPLNETGFGGTCALFRTWNGTSMEKAVILG